MFETLEDRRLFSISLVGGDLRLDGRTLTNDDFGLTIVNGGTAIRVEHAKRFTDTVFQTATFALSAVNRIVANLGSGDDRLAITSGSVVSKRFVVDAGSGNDLIGGSEGNDDIRGGRGNDTVFAGSGNDVVHGDDGDDALFGNAGTDQLFGDDGNDKLDGGAGADVIRGGAGSDQAVSPTPGDDVDLGAGTDGLTIHGTGGDDAIQIRRRVTSGGAVADIVANGVTTSVAYRSGETITVRAFAGNDYVAMDPSAGVTWRAAFYGGGGSDLLVGTHQPDLLDGGHGVDLLVGNGGDDELRSGTVVG